MSVAIVVPLDIGHDEVRFRNWSWLRARWTELHPDWEIVTATASTDPFSKGRLVNDAVARTRADATLVIADADVFTLPEAVISCVRAVEGGLAEWAVPFRDVWRLDETRTRELLARPPTYHPDAWPRPPPWHLDRPVYRGKAGGGLVVVSRGAFDYVHGFDPRFVGWGGEDKAFGWALRVLAGPPAKAVPPLWHLWHPPSPFQPDDLRTPRENMALQERYRRANREVTMLALVAEHGGMSGCRAEDAGSAAPRVKRAASGGKRRARRTTSV